ncbi:MAG: DUF3325 domain-containing protein [Sphingopyxis sp.]|uniref:DUF3325 family protein n=1 Tax=Sphingopyxis sp. TaxID=1908224 RepID=UPI001A18D2A6|nr:DUF3325 family protein [Sphingopyxis sp.]MBJ7499621.1 DUF3325 domain-containing protein [Sphingopyxis sp.]
MIHLLLLLLTAIGFGLLCLSRARHQSDLLGRKLTGKAANRARWGGLFSLALAFFVAGDRIGWAAGTLEWLGAASVGAVSTMLMLSLRSSRNSSR